MSGPGTGAPGDYGQARAVVPVAEPGTTPVEEHLGERLTALVDGELDHDSRERVLAHIATCAECRTEAEEQRRLKEAFAAASVLAPGPSAGLLARLQSLPGSEGPFSGGGGGSSPLDSDVFGTGKAGFRIHEIAERPPAHRGRRFAFAAAGALSMAAVALGGAVPEEVPSGGLPEDPGTSSVTPVSVYSGQYSSEMADPTTTSSPIFANPASLITRHHPTTSPSHTPTMLARHALP